MKVVFGSKLFELIIHNGADNFLVLGSEMSLFTEPIEVFDHPNLEVIYATEADKELIKKIFKEADIEENKVPIIMDEAKARIDCGEEIIVIAVREKDQYLSYLATRVFYPTNNRARKVMEIFSSNSDRVDRFMEVIE